MRRPPRAVHSRSRSEQLRAELHALLETPLGTHRKTILANHPPLDEILAGRCPVVLYPAARMASKAAELLQARRVDVRGFSDKSQSKWGQTINDLPVVSPERIASLAPGGAVLVASSLYDSAIRGYLAGLGCTNVYSMPYLNYRLPEVFSSREYFQATEAPFRPGAREAILQLFDLLTDDSSRHVLVSKIRYCLTLEKHHLDAILSSQPIYFDPEILSLRAGEIVVDGGAFNGDTLRQFLNISADGFRRYHAFEPDPGAFAELQQVASADPGRIECVRAGLSDQTGTLRFSVTGAADSAVAAPDDPSAIILPVVDLDSYFSGREQPTLIKMDIEGSERAALRGARGLVAKHRPILAVSAYHYPRDLWEIPDLIHDLDPAYRLFLRHYTREIDDTVCYAVPPERLGRDKH
jgi:FkbM family methyltransferase